MEQSTLNTTFKPDEDGLIRLQKLLAHRGLASRRNAEEMIRGGLVKVNGIVVTVPGTKVHPETDRVTVDGKNVPVEPEPFLFLFYKPKGVVSTLHDPDGKTTLKDFFPRINPLIHVGRLDIQSEGVLLLTNNGDLAQRILHPRYEIPRTYLVKVQGVVTPEHLDRLRSGKVRLDGRPVQPLELEQERLTETNSWYRITLTEGRNREVRRLFDALHYFVLKLTRIAFGNLDLTGLEPGEYRLVTPEEIDLLLSGARWKRKEAIPPPERSPRKPNFAAASSPDFRRRSVRSRPTFPDRAFSGPVDGNQEEDHFPRQTRQGYSSRPDTRSRGGTRSDSEMFFHDRPPHRSDKKQESGGPSFQKNRGPHPGNMTDRGQTSPSGSPDHRTSRRREPGGKDSFFREDRQAFSEQSGKKHFSGPSVRRENNRNPRSADDGPRHRKNGWENRPRSSEGTRDNHRSFPPSRKEDERNSRFADDGPRHRKNAWENRPRSSEGTRDNHRFFPPSRKEDERNSRFTDDGPRHRKNVWEDRPRSSGNSRENQRSSPPFRREDDRNSRYSGTLSQKKDPREESSREPSPRGSSAFRKRSGESSGTGHKPVSRESSSGQSRKPGSTPRGRKGPGKNHPHHS
ncbi:Ribosomal large subunit pseudouridine synthase B [Leptospirillum ferriphilum]|uniref:Pseudouridine synthase n=1 Tax=Leptospirillum ferriphilum TaxID=178606 RepID=A0A094WCD2_9BACT|nr:pseudouridine synthase [Leptospirillum ferriphilum]KGA93332.1 Ribosomal large subunit pseudouridine synthase B [Leptospirillum ferriphilum]